MPDSSFGSHRVPPAVAEGIMPFRDGGEIVEREDMVNPVWCFVDPIFGRFAGLRVGEDERFNCLYSPDCGGTEHSGYVVGHAFLIDFGKRCVEHVSGILVPQVSLEVIAPISTFRVLDWLIQFYEGGILGNDAAAGRAFYQDIAGDSLVLGLAILEIASVVEERQTVVLSVVLDKVVLGVDLIPRRVLQSGDFFVAEHASGVEVD